MDMNDVDPIDPAPVVESIKKLAERLRPHVPALVPDGPAVSAETAFVYDDGLRLQVTVTLRLVFPTKGSA